MPRIGQENAVNEGPNIQKAYEEAMVETELAQPLPDNVVTLSSGVRVQFFKKLPEATVQQVVTTTFQNANLKDDGTVSDNMTQIEQLKLAQRMFDYNKSLLSFALAFKALDLYGELPADKTWLSYLKINPQVRNDNPDIVFSDPIHQKILYLLYEGFATAADWDIMSTRLLK